MIQGAGTHLKCPAQEPKLTPAEQFRRFREAVKKLEVDETGKPLDQAFRKRQQANE